MACSTNHKNCIAAKLVDAYNVVIKPEHKDEIMQTLDNHIQAMLYNIASIASVTALLDEKTKIELKHIDFVKKYITVQCSKHKKHGGEQQGGSMPAEYFGYDSGAYTEANYGGVSSDVVWSGSDAAIRPELNMYGGEHGLNKVKNIIGNNTEVSKYMKQVMSFNDVKVSKPAMSELVKLVNIHLNCVGDDIKHVEKLKPSSLEKLFKHRKHAVFK
jgi:hypothetical protein